ncbi:MAG TPA: TolC family protein [Candidatus Nitrosotenuis sp.]|nr:TolC family protein [Candidatus Nitrosotenuis sp.]
MRTATSSKTKILVGGFFLCLLYFLAASAAAAQTFPQPDYFRKMHYNAPGQLPGPEGLKEHVVDGKLRLSLADAIQLVLANNTDVQINRLSYESSRFGVLRAYQPFDPVFNASFTSNRATSPTTSQLEGAATLSTLSQSTNTSWTQTFQTGTRLQISFSGSKNTTNSTFSTFNPSIGSSLNFNLSQPLLRSRWLFANRAPIVIAQRSLRQSRANFEVQVSDSVRSAIDQYWSVVQARENLKVLRKSLELAEATYKQNKRALELGALPPLDIYRSESQVATRRVAVIQAEYDLRQLEDAFRRTVGADLDPLIRALDLDLTDTPESAGELLAIDAQQALEQAFARRPELEAQRLQLANEDTSVRLAHNNLQPDLNFSTFYNSSGRGGNQLDPSTTPPTVLSQGGLIQALEQLSGFDFPSYGFTLTLRLPIRNRGAQADLGSALISQRRSLYTMRQREQSISLEVRNAVHQLEQAKLSMAASRIARDLALKNLEAEQRKYELGVQTIFFVLDAQTQLATAEQNLLQAQISYRRAVTSLDRATGTLLERNNVKIQ